MPDQPDTSPHTKSKWEIILTTTPVVLTVLGTLLAGLSSSEITLAQYYRTLAAQSQAKASDQWAFFQAKRIRGTSLELFVKQLPLLARQESDLGETSGQLVADLRQTDVRVKRLQQSLVEAKANADAGEAARKLATQTAEALTQAETMRGQLAKLVAEVDKPTELSVDAIASKLAGRQPLPAGVQQALADLKAGKPEDDLEKALAGVPSHQLDNALLDADADVRALRAALDPRQRQLQEVARVVDAQAALLPPLYRQVRQIESLLGDARQPALKDVRASVGDVVADGDLLRQRMSLLEQSFLAQRYRQEADRNQAIAELYELQVRQESGRAERHRHRSRSFFYGMLIAQAGVTVSSLALAARQKNLLWAVAGVAGLAALLFSAYVYLFV